MKLYAIFVTGHFFVAERNRTPIAQIPQIFSVLKADWARVALNCASLRSEWRQILSKRAVFICPIRENQRLIKKCPVVSPEIGSGALSRMIALQLQFFNNRGKLSKAA